MTPFPRSFELSEDGDCYYVRCRIDQRERIKAIPGRNWDSGAGHWIIPRTANNHDLLAEIVQGDCLRFDITRPDPLGAKLNPQAESTVEVTPQQKSSIENLVGAEAWKRLHPAVQHAASRAEDIKVVPTLLGEELERRLGMMISVSSPVENSLMALMRQAEEAGLMNKNQMNLAHCVRLERNYFTHSRPQANNEDLRAIIAMVATSLLLETLES